MSVENSSIIDFVSTDKNGAIVLTISDHPEWGCHNPHVLLLQEKISSYINAIEGGDLFRKYPHAKDKKNNHRLNKQILAQCGGSNFFTA